MTTVAGDASDPAALAELIRGTDAVVSALHFDVPAATLVSALKAAGVPRLLVTGGAASLETAPGRRVIDKPDFPAAWRSLAEGGIAFLDAIREELVTSYGVTLGPEGDLINPGPDSCRQIKLDNPILGNAELALFRLSFVLTR